MTNVKGMSRGELESLLRFYAESGLDFPLADEPDDRFNQVTPVKRESANAAPSERTVPPAPIAESRLPAIPDAEAIALAKEVAAHAGTLNALRTAVETFEGCNLKLTSRNTVFEGGLRGASVMFVSDPPGRDDDANGEAYCGPEGQLLDRMLAAIGQSRETCYFGFVTPWRVPGNAAPSPLQTAICKPFIERQIELADPKFLVMMGNSAARILLDTHTNILQLRGEWQTFRAASQNGLPAIATLHPRYLLEQPAQKRFAWLDLQEIRERLNSTTT